VIGTGPRAAGIDTLRLQIFFFPFFPKKKFYFFHFFSGVETHFVGQFAAASCDQPGKQFTAEIVGAMTHEVALLNGLTVNLHLALRAFYKPTKDRFKLVFEDHAFPSDLVRLIHEHIITQPCNTTITQPCNTTITQPCNATIMQSCSTTITQPCKATIFQPCNTKITQSCNATIFQPCNVTITQPCNTKITQACNATITQPYNKIIAQPCNKTITQQSCNLVTQQ
jgi:hypothetical protein